MLRFAVCDDEPFMLEQISAMLSAYMKTKGLDCEVAEFSSGSRLLAELQINGGQPKDPWRKGSPDRGSGLADKRAFDVIFLDIEMVPPDGLETARILRAWGFEGLLIFITVLKERVFDSFEVQTFDYLVKPVESCQLRKTMDRALLALDKSRNQGKSGSLMIQTGRGSQIIPFWQILYCEVLGHQIHIHRQGGEGTAYYEKMTRLAQQVDRRFFRCHRSYLVNLDWVRGHRDGMILLEGGKRVPLSRLREQDFTQALLAHMKERRD